MNNNLTIYSARATAEELTIDRNEIGDARWFDIAKLRRRADAAGAAAQPVQGRVELEVGGLAPGLEPGGSSAGSSCPTWLLKLPHLALAELGTRINASSGRAWQL